MKDRILIVDDIHEVFLKNMTRRNISFDYRPDITYEETLACINDYTGLVIRSKFIIGGEFLKQASRLRFIARAGAGMDNIEEAIADQLGITLINAPEGNRDAVGEHMVGMLLMLLNHLKRGDAEIRQHQWNREKNRGHELMGKTVAIIGYGNNGQAMAKKLSGFEVEVIAYDKYKTGFSDPYVQEVSMEEVVKKADIVSFHIPLTQETKGMIDDEYLFHFRKPIYLLMGARGGIVNIPSVMKAMDNGKIIGAAFDVLPVEKFPEINNQSWSQDLLSRENVILSPHVAGWTYESYYKIAEVLSDKIWKFLKN